MGQWVATVRLEQGDHDDHTHWTAGDTILHYNGTALMHGFRALYDGWLPLPEGTEK